MTHPTLSQTLSLVAPAAEPPPVAAARYLHAGREVRHRIDVLRVLLDWLAASWSRTPMQEGGRFLHLALAEVSRLEDLVSPEVVRPHRQPHDLVAVAAAEVSLLAELAWAARRVVFSCDLPSGAPKVLGTATGVEQLARRVLLTALTAARPDTTIEVRALVKPTTVNFVVSFAHREPLPPQQPRLAGLQRLAAASRASFRTFPGPQPQVTHLVAGLLRADRRRNRRALRDAEAGEEAARTGDSAGCTGGDARARRGTGSREVPR